MEHLHQEHKNLTEEIRVLKKIANATKVAHACRKHGDDLAANCIESLIREIERIRENTIKSVVVFKGKATPPKFELGEDDK
jgi:hypothetical protein